MIQRVIGDMISAAKGSRKAIVIMGARQVGKTTLLKALFQDKKYQDKVLWLSGDEIDVRDLFKDISSTRLKSILGNATILVIDEAQRIENIGLKLKLVTDYIPDVQVIATGSSSFELSEKIREPLTGRKFEMKMFPLTFGEMVTHLGLLDEMRLLPHRLVYGYYPEVVTSVGSEKTILRELSDSYLYRDVLTLDGIKKSDHILNLLKALAYQIGSQVSYNELAQLVGLDSKTVEKYITILEKAFVVFRLPSFARNARNELKSSRKVYFWDLGIRNALIANFAQIENRTDVGELWENFVIAERMKKLSYQNSFAHSWFWRNQQQNEIDYLEEEDGILKAFEFKWNIKKSKVKCPDSFVKAYPDVQFSVITPQNVDGFLL